MKKVLWVCSLLGCIFLVWFFVFKGESGAPPVVVFDSNGGEAAERAEDLVVSKWGAVVRENVTIGELMDLYREWSGEKVAGDPGVLRKKGRFVMRGPFTPTEGVRFLEMALKLDGYTIVENEGLLSIREVPFELTEEQKLEAGRKPRFENEITEKLAYAEGEVMSYPGILMGAAAQIFEDASGRRVLLGMDTAYSDFSVRVEGPANNREIAEGIWKALNEAGYGFFEVPGYEDLLWLVVADEDKVAKARQEKAKRVSRMRYVPRAMPKTKVGNGEKTERRTRFVPRPR